MSLGLQVSGSQGPKVSGSQLWVSRSQGVKILRFEGVKVSRSDVDCLFKTLSVDTAEEQFETVSSLFETISKTSINHTPVWT